MDIVIKKLHSPWPNVRLAAGLRMKIEPDVVAQAICDRGFAEKISQDILDQEAKAKAESEAPKKEKKGK